MAGTVADIIEFVKFGKVCLDFYQEARLNTPQKHNELRLRLEVEAIVFDRWCSAIGLKDMIIHASANPGSWQDGAEFQAFRDLLEEELRFSSPLISALIIDVLKGLGHKFSDARNRLQPGTGDTGKTDTKPVSKWMPWNRKKSIASRDSGEQVQIGPIGLVSAARYLVWDKKYFLQHLEDLTSINEALVKLLDPGKQTQVLRQTNIQILSTNGTLVLSTAQSLPSPQPRHSIVGALAGLKQISIFENQAEGDVAMNQSPETGKQNTNVRVPQYSIEDFEQSTMRLGPSRVHATLNQIPVLIEWKFFSDSHPLRFEQIIRLGSLVNLLNQQQIYKQFHIPRCRGLVKDEKNHRLGLIFDIPLPKAGGSPQWHSLQSLIIRTTQRVIAPPSTTSRIKAARELAIAVHYLLSVHWLHKSLRSDNIIYFDDSQAPVPVNCSIHDPDTTMDPEKMSNAQNVDGVPSARSPSALAQLPPLYVLGLDLSRPDHPSELSLSQSTSAHRSTADNVELYSHPDSLKKKDADTKPRYEARFDIYSFGLILLELGLWRSLHDMRKSPTKGVKGVGDDHKLFETKYCDRLRGSMGDIYWRATQRCLLTDFDLGDVPAGTNPGIALQLAFEKQVLSELERCTV